jgi:hypothetical protein
MWHVGTWALVLGRPRQEAIQTQDGIFSCSIHYRLYDFLELRTSSHPVGTVQLSPRETLLASFIMGKVDAAIDIVPNFTLLAPCIYEYTPPFVNRLLPSSTDEPAAIILCTWTGALQRRHVAKYTARYQSLFPSTPIIVIATTSRDFWFRDSRRKQQRLRSAVKRLYELGNANASGNPTGILMHVFSEGGSNKACELVETFHRITGNRLPISAMCLDSTPGHPHYSRLCNAMNKSLPATPVLRQTGIVVCGAVVGSVWMTYKVVKEWEDNIISTTRRRLLDPKYFDLTAPRCYLYSQEDALIAWQDVHEHAAESLRKDVPVKEIIFEGSGHVGHAKQDPEKYWDAVLATWRSASVAGEKHCRPGVVEDVAMSKSRRTETFWVWSDDDSERTVVPDHGVRVYAH